MEGLFFQNFTVTKLSHVSVISMFIKYRDF